MGKEYPSIGRGFDSSPLGVISLFTVQSEGMRFAVPRSEGCLNGRSRCGMEGSLIPKRLNGIDNEHEPIPWAGLQ